MHRRPAIVALLLGGVVALACKEATPPTPVPTSITLNATTVTFDALGAQQALTAVVADQFGATMTGQTVTWSSADPTVATVSPTGTVAAAGNGQTSVTASLGSVTASAAVTVAQVATQLFVIRGDGQTGAVGEELTDTLMVELRDSRGNPVPGGTSGQLANSLVMFAVSSGGGSIDPASADVGTDGRASGVWTLGPTLGAQSATANTAGGAISTTFSATGIVGAADSLDKVSGDGQTGTVSLPLPDSIVVRVTDRFGNAYPGGVKVGYTVTSGGGSVSADTVLTDTDGRAAVSWTMGSAVGTQTMTAGAVGITKGSPATFTATASTSVLTAIEKVAGDSLVGLIGKPTNTPPTVKVVDQVGDGVEGVTVDFAVTSGGGSVSSASAVTDTAGLASVAWTLGGSAGANALQVSSGALTPVTFDATGQAAAFTIDLRYFGTQLPTTSQQAAFAAAKARWEELIFGDLADISVSLPADWCGSSVPGLPAISETIDDVVIYAAVDTIDGPGNILGGATYCYARGSGPSAGLPMLGVMIFDKDDVPALEASGDFDRIILHEMGHVLGIGSEWVPPGSFTSLLVGACSSSSGCTTDPHFIGSETVAAFDRIGGTAYVAGQKVPVEDCRSGVPPSCGSGTINVHWRERVLDTELMTGYYVSGTATPLSVVTVASLQDMHYLTNYSDADAFTWPAPPALRAAGSGRVIDLGNDILRVPITFVDERGRVLRVVKP